MVGSGFPTAIARLCRDVRREGEEGGYRVENGEVRILCRGCAVECALQYDKGGSIGRAESLCV